MAIGTRMSPPHGLYDSMRKWADRHKDWIYLATIIGLILAVVAIAGYTWLSTSD
jgi:hypothetical protein